MNEYKCLTLEVLTRTRSSRLLKNPDTRKQGWVKLTDISRTEDIGADMFKVTAQGWVFKKAGLL